MFTKQNIAVKNYFNFPNPELASWSTGFYHGIRRIMVIRVEYERYKFRWVYLGGLAYFDSRVGGIGASFDLIDQSASYEFREKIIRQRFPSMEDQERID